MSDSSEVFKNIVDQNPIGIKDALAQAMLAKVQDIVADRKMEIAHEFLGASNSEEADEVEGTDETDEADEADESAEDIEAETDEIGDEEDSNSDTDTQEDQGDDE